MAETPPIWAPTVLTKLKTPKHFANSEEQFWRNTKSSPSAGNLGTFWEKLSPWTNLNSNIYSKALLNGLINDNSSLCKQVGNQLSLVGGTLKEIWEKGKFKDLRKPFEIIFKPGPTKTITVILQLPILRSVSVGLPWSQNWWWKRGMTTGVPIDHQWWWLRTKEILVVVWRL